MKHMKLTTWDDAFAPILAQGREIREGQRTLGNAVIEAVNKGGNLIAECSTGTGKSYGTLLPVIIKVLESKGSDKPYRAAVSTETIILQNQIFGTDLPFLATLYPGFTYAKLMGRSNYLCLDAADGNKIGVAGLDALVEVLKGRADSIDSGEKEDVERVIGRKLTDDEWEKIQGSSSFCADNQCSPEVCFGAKSRKRAKEVDIVVVNHAILATDLEIKLNATANTAGEDGLLGTIDALVVDEGHQLAPVLVEQWTKELSQWELSNLASSVTAGIEHAQNVSSNASIGRLTQESLDDFGDALKSIQTFLSLLAEKDGEKWAGSSHAVCLKYLTSRPAEYIMRAMEDYETQNPIRFANIEDRLVKAQDYLQKAMIKATIEKLKKKSKISKANRAAGELLSIVRILSKAIETKDGIVSEYGVYGVTVQGWEKRDGTPGMTLRMKPMDISSRAQYLFHNRTNILVSATLTDLTDGSFRYLKASTGFPAAKELKVSTPFDLRTQQLIYMTPANGERVSHLRGAQFAKQELLDLINAARGRSLVLFTSREELDWAAGEIRQMEMMGLFKYPVLVQEKDSDKAELVRQFKSVTDSVLFATKSFFVGIDVPGEALSAVWICKWPNPMYNAECRQQVQYWKMRGFREWYTRESLTTFQQALGRLIRSSGCKGVVGVLDFRVSNPKDNVYKAAKIGVDAIGSPVTINIEDVKRFFAST